MKNFVHIRNRCNISASGYSQTVIDGTCRLASAFDLNMPQIYSCQRAYEYVSHTTVFYGVGVEIILALGKEKIPRIFFLDYAIGWVLAKLNCHLFYEN